MNLTTLTNVSPMDYYNNLDPITFKTNELVKLCGEFSTQSKTAAIIGLVLALLSLFYFGRWRPALATTYGEKVVWIDKTLLIGIAMCFALIITRLYYGG